MSTDRCTVEMILLLGGVTDWYRGWRYRIIASPWSVWVRSSHCISMSLMSLCTLWLCTIVTTVVHQSVRTNNDVEGWHICLNYRAGNGNPPFYILVLLLFRELRLLKLQSKLLGKENCSDISKWPANQHKVYYLNSGVNTSRETATHRCFSRYEGKYMPLL